MVWAIIKIYTSKCAQMDPQQLLKTSKLYSKSKKCDIEKTLGGLGTTPLGSPKVKRILGPNILSKCSNHQPFFMRYFLIEEFKGMRSDKYHIWQFKAVVAALATSLSGYKSNSWRRSRAPVPDGH